MRSVALCTLVLGVALTGCQSGTGSDAAAPAASSSAGSAATTNTTAVASPATAPTEQPSPEYTGVFKCPNAKKVAAAAGVAVVLDDKSDEHCAYLVGGPTTNLAGEAVPGTKVLVTKPDYIQRSSLDGLKSELAGVEQVEDLPELGAGAFKGFNDGLCSILMKGKDGSILQILGVKVPGPDNCTVVKLLAEQMRP